MGLDFTVIGIRLKNARLKKKFTQEKLAELLGVSVTYLSRIERGSLSINLKRLAEICSILDVSEGEILTGAFEKSNHYLSEEFSDLLKNCPPEKMKLIYNVAKIIINGDKKVS